MKKLIIFLGVICLLALPGALRSEYVAINGLAFTNGGGGSASWYTYNGSEHYLYMTASSTAVDRRWWAPVYFPVSGTSNKVVRISARVYDNDATQSILVRLYKINIYNGTAIQVGNDINTGSSSTPGEVLVHEVPATASDLRLYCVKISWN
jgi:hypothetical protein